MTNEEARDTTPGEPPEEPAVRWSSEMQFLLVAGEEILGTLTVAEIDFPWVYCDFEPAERFAAFKPLFDAELELLDGLESDEGIALWEEAYRRIEALWLLLVPLRGGAPIESFLLHIEGDRAWFRY